MKKLIFIIAISSLVVLLASCASAPTPTVSRVAVLKDITQKHLAMPDATEVVSLFDFTGDNKWNGADFEFGDLSDVSYNRFSEVKINTADMWMSNELDRDKEIKDFKNKVSKIVTLAGNDTIGKRNSSIYLPIARKLNELAQSKAQRKILLIYSDLMENTIDVSFYNKKTLAELETNPEAIGKQLEQLQALQNLNGIEVYFIYQPNDAENDKVFTLVSALYKRILEDKGAITKISANINF